MKHDPNKQYYRHRFDFEIGCLAESPCRECNTREMFPRCIDECKMLDKIHTLLANAVSCSRHI